MQDISPLGRYSNLVIDAELKKHDCSERDAALATAIFYGVLERKITIDYYIKKHATIKVAKISPLALQCIRIGICQILYMDKIPHSAAVNESVNIVKASKEKHTAGFVNAVLRAVIKTGHNIQLPTEERERLSVQYSCQIPLMNSYIEDFGKEMAIEILKSNLEKPPITIRVNTTRIQTDKLIELFAENGIQAVSSPICENALNLSGTGSIEKLATFHQGYFHIQDTASQLCVKTLDPQKGERVLDVCAAPGGKSFTIAERMEDEGEVLSLDIHPHKIGLIQNGAERLGLKSIRTFENDAGQYNPVLGKFTKVLCDLPCSGLGIIRKKPEIGYNIVAFLDNLPKIQYSLLCISAQYVEDNGILVYSTCTLRKKENEEIAQRFLENHKEFLPIPVLPELKRAYEQPTNMITLFPHLHGTDGFFISAFQKKG